MTDASNAMPTLIERSICVFCGASETVDGSYISLASRVGERIANDGYRLVYGGGKMGLMGATARGAHENGGDVLGIIPGFLTELEGVYEDVEHVLVDDMHTRKQMMYDASGAFIVLPGGIGTLEEAVEVMSWMRLDLHSKPIIFLAENDYWDPLETLLDHIIREDFAPAEMKKHIFMTHSLDKAMGILMGHGLKVGKEAGVASAKLSDL